MTDRLTDQRVDQLMKLATRLLLLEKAGVITKEERITAIRKAEGLEPLPRGFE